jgi:3-deoxy-D-manno-octulosonic-acid transferase
MAYVGGAFGAGLHNILEASVYGLPVFFGKSRGNRKYQEAVDLVQLGGAFEVRNHDELKSMILDLMEDTAKRNQIKTINNNYLKNGAGAATKIMDGMNEILE